MQHESQHDDSSMARVAQERDDLQIELNTLESEKVSVQQLAKERDELQSQVNKQTSQISTLESEKGSLRSSHKQATKERNDLHSQVSKQASTISTLQSERASAGMKSSRYLLGRYTSEVNGMSFEDSASFDGMMCCQKHWMELREEYDASSVNGIVERRMPMMMFVQERTPLDPVTHAMNFWMAVNQNKLWFADSQALFNAGVPASRAAEAYHWVFNALEKALMDIQFEKPTDQLKVLEFKRALTILQGVAYISYLAQSMGRAVSPIQKLLDNFADCFRRLKLFGPGSIIESVFGKVQSSLEGNPIQSWVSAPTSNLENQQRLDESNSAIGVGHCLIGDPVAMGNFVLIHQIDNEEILYSFTDQEVERLYFTADLSLRLVFSDNLVSRRLGNELYLTLDADEHACVWAELYLVHKL